MGRTASDRRCSNSPKDWVDVLHSDGGNDISAAQMDQTAAHAHRVAYESLRPDRSQTFGRLNEYNKAFDEHTNKLRVIERL
jgi:hypothetical protein